MQVDLLRHTHKHRFTVYNTHTRHKHNSPHYTKHIHSQSHPTPSSQRRPHKPATTSPLKKCSIYYASPCSSAAIRLSVCDMLSSTRSGLGFVVARPPVCCWASVATDLLPTATNLLPTPGATDLLSTRTQSAFCCSKPPTQTRFVFCYFKPPTRLKFLPFRL